MQWPIFNRSADDKYNDSEDFKKWVERYFHIHGDTEVTSVEWWAARNAIIHTYGAYSRLHDTPGVRVIGWMVHPKYRVKYNPRINQQLVLVDILAMRDAFFEGMDNFLIQGFSDPARKHLMEKRVNELTMTFEEEITVPQNSA